jgi:hypothetical protein
LVLLALYLTAYVKIARSLTKEGHEIESFDREQVKLSWITFVCSGALIAAVFLAERYGVYVVASVSIWFLVSGSIESWRFLDPIRAKTAVDEAATNEESKLVA